MCHCKCNLANEKGYREMCGTDGIKKQRDFIGKQEIDDKCHDQVTIQILEIQKNHRNFCLEATSTVTIYDHCNNAI